MSFEYFHFRQANYTLECCFSNCHLGTHNISIAQMLVRCAGSWSPFHIWWESSLAAPNSLGNSHAWLCLRSAASSATLEAGGSVRLPLREWALWQWTGRQTQLTRRVFFFLLLLIWKWFPDSAETRRTQHHVCKIHNRNRARGSYAPCVSVRGLRPG